MLTRLRTNVPTSLIAWTAAACLCARARPVSAQEAADVPREVQVALLLADLTEVRDAEQAFAADVMLAATWVDESLAGGDAVRSVPIDEVWHPTLLISNRRSVSEAFPREVTVQPDGLVTYIQRYTGLFSALMDLRAFPQDRQEFFVWVVSPARVGTPVRLLPMESQATVGATALSIADWEIGELGLGPESFQLAPGAPVNPGIKLTIPARRRVTYYVIQVLIPLIAIVMMSYTVFWIPPTVIPTRVGVVVTTMLTLIAYRFMLGNHVPRLSYLTRLDWFMLGSTLLVLLTLFTMGWTSYLTRHEREDAVKRIDRAGRILYPAVFAALVLIAWA